MDNLGKLQILSIKELLSYQAAIVEDEPDILQHIRKSLSQAFSAQHVHIAFDSFLSGIKLLEMMKDHYHYDLIFLDIEMPEMDGIEVCRQIRKLAPDTLTVFISGKDELVFQTFEVQPFRFIRKSQFESQLPILAEACVNHLKLQHRRILQLKETHSGDLFSFQIDKIKYIEAAGKTCRIYLEDDITVIKDKFTKFEELLSEYAFLKPHRSYLVNCDYIKYIGKNYLKLTDQTEIPLSRNKAEEFKQQFLNYNTR